jgi:hypothetical protein
LPGKFREEFPKLQAAKSFTRSLFRLAEWSFWTLLEATGGDPKHTRAEQEES